MIPFNLKAITDFVSRLSKKEKILFYGASTVITIFMLDRLVLQPVVGTFRSLHQETQDLQSNIKRSVHLLSQKERMMKEVEQYSVYNVRGKSPEEETVALLKLIEELANQASVNLLYVKPGGTKTDGAMQKYYATLECEGQMNQMLGFFYQLESTHQLLKIEKYSLQPTAKGSSVVKCAATIAKTVV